MKYLRRCKTGGRCDVTFTEKSYYGARRDTIYHLIDSPKRSRWLEDHKKGTVRVSTLKGPVI